MQDWSGDAIARRRCDPVRHARTRHESLRTPARLSRRLNPRTRHLRTDRARLQDTRVRRFGSYPVNPANPAILYTSAPMHRPLLVFTLFISLITINAQSIREQDIRAELGFLASDAMQGRGSGTIY